MCKSVRKLDKFVQRFNQGEFGYCSHRLRKFTRRRQDAVEAMRFVLNNYRSVPKDLEEYPQLVSEMLGLAGEAARNKVEYLDLVKLALDSGLHDLNEKAVAEAPDDLLLEIVKLAAAKRNGAGCSPIRRYLLAERKQGLLNGIHKAYELDDEILPDVQTYFFNDSAERKEVWILLDQFQLEAFEDFLGLFQGKAPTSLVFDGDCRFTNEFGDFGFDSADEFVQWADGFAGDRGPLIVETAVPTDLMKQADFNLARQGWLNTRVAVVKDSSDDGKALFVVLIGSDLRDGKVRKVWISTDNRLWDLDFEAPKYQDETVTITRKFSVDPDAAAEAGEQCRTGNTRPDDPSRSTRANELAAKIRSWTADRSDKHFRQVVWAIAVDAMFGKTVFVPSSFSRDGTVKATGPVGPDGQRIYLCYTDCPADSQTYTELRLSAFLATALGDEQTIGVAFKSVDGKVLVRRNTLEELARKVGPDLTGGEEITDAAKKD